ncbi:SDR family oxidoreductase [Nocardia australiensis]|uniref:SDR family oxidoreductase n=1 Tax=Nocardia australiensis TaxID=2887191 RepID=UPI001D15BA80|nr:SDR family oxidoreductase [Nocardia australiensis]
MTRVVVIGGTGLIGSKVTAKLEAEGHEVIAASPKTGVNTLTKEGLAEVLTGTQVVVDVSNSPSFDDDPVLEFFTTSTRNLLAEEKAAGVGHHVALSVVGTPDWPDSGYFRAKNAQEMLIDESDIPFSIVRATQFFEFVEGIAASASEGDSVRLPPALVQPMAAEDVAEGVTRTSLGQPVNGVVQIAGPEQFGLDEFVRTGLAFRNDSRHVVTDPCAPYYGAVVPDERLLVPGDADDAQIFQTRFTDWLARNAV